MERELSKRVNAPYFLVTMTVPEVVRPISVGRHAKVGYDLFMSAAARALAEKLQDPKSLRAQVSGFTAGLHTWGQRMQFHPHIHFLVPGTGIDAQGSVVRVRSEKMLVHHKKLAGAWRAHFKTGLEALGWELDPAVWRCQCWGAHILFGLLHYFGVSALSTDFSRKCQSAQVPGESPLMSRMVVSPPASIKSIIVSAGE